MKSFAQFIVGTLRIGAYWALLAIATYGSFRALETYWPDMSVQQLADSVGAASSPFAVFRDKHFAIALSGLIGAAAIGFWIASLLSVVFIRASLTYNRRWIVRNNSETSFAQNLQWIKNSFCRSRLLGHAFQQFAKTILIEPGSPPLALSTARPQVFINSATSALVDASSAAVLKARAVFSVLSNWPASFPVRAEIPLASS
jgi:hypothetical protein